MKKEKVKIYEARRNMTSLEVVDWSGLIDADHLARRIVRVLDQLDLSTFYAKIVSRDSHQGRPAIDPKIMLAIWIYAYMQGISSSRVVADYCKWEPGFRWILGHGLSIKHVSLSDFRKNLGTNLDDMLTQVVTLMVSAGVVDLDEVILDGTKIKASAGSNSFHTQQELEDLRDEVSKKIKALDSEPHKQKQQLALKKKKERVERGLQQIPEIQQACIEVAKKQKKGTKPKEAKASSTDPDARKMYFSDGSTNSGYNPQVMTTPKSGVIVDVKATQDRNDSNLMSPMLDSFKSRYGKYPKRFLADSHYPVQKDVVEALENEIDVYCPTRKGRKNSKEESKKRLGRKRLKEPQALQDWRAKMETEEARTIRKRRSQTEKVHGWIKSKMPHSQLKLRGLVGVQTEMLLFSVAYNLKRYFNMTPLKAV